MTGFARVASDTEPTIEVAIRSVNHRFLDLKLRSPHEFEGLDPMIRRMVKKHVKRGALQISINLASQTDTALELNAPLAEAYLAAYRDLAERSGVSEPPDLTNLLRIPGVLASTDGGISDEAQSERAEALERTLVAALEALTAERAREGAGLADEVRRRTDEIARETAELSQASAALIPQFRERLERRLNELLGDSAVEPQRLMQEAAVLADRTDVSEELQRLAAHAQRLLELLDVGGEIGKKMDFLAQEMNREANTLLSKSTPLGEAGLPVTEAGLRLKAEIEKIREQAQNLE